tara:strand:+ start:8629 stop:9816 length:1188 start_codon:yes stop_codon:yes gene_type:complete
MFERKKKLDLRVRGFFFSYFSFLGVFSPFLSLWLSFRGFSAGEIGVLLSPMQWARIFGPLVWGSVVDNNSKDFFVPRLLCFLGLISFCFAISMLFKWSFLQLFVILCLLNFFLSGLVPIVEMIALQESKRDLGNYGKIRVWGSIGFFISVVTAGIFLDTLGLVFFPIIILALLLLVSLVSFFLPNTKILSQERNFRKSEFLFTLNNSKFLIASFFMLFAHAPLYVLFSLWLDFYGFNKYQIGYIWAVGVLAEIIFFINQKKIFRLFRNVNYAWRISFFVAALRFLLIVVSQGNIVIILIAQLLHAVTFALHHSASVILVSDLFPKGAQARAQSFYTVASYGLGGSFGGILAGILWDFFKPESGFIMAIIAACIGGLVACSLKLKGSNKQRNQDEK